MPKVELDFEMPKGRWLQLNFEPYNSTWYASLMDKEHIAMPWNGEGKTSQEAIDAAILKGQTNG